MLIRPYGIPNKGAYYTMLCSEVAIGKMAVCVYSLRNCVKTPYLKSLTLTQTFLDFSPYLYYNNRHKEINRSFK